MRLFGSAIIAVVVLFLVDLEVYNGRYSSAAFLMIRNVGRSLGVG
jgi:hypothetical protein